MAITTGHWGKAIYPGVSKWYGMAYEELPKLYTKMVNVESSRRAFEEYVGTSGFGQAQVIGEGAAVSYDTNQQGFINRANAVKYGLGFVITKEMYDDDLYDVAAQKRAKALAQSIVSTQETVVANLFNRAHTSGYTFGDGKTMCATDHPNVAGGTFSNTMSTAADFSETALEQAEIDLAKMTNDRGLRINVRATDIILPPDIQFEVRRLMASQLRMGTPNNDANLHKGELGMIINPYLTDTDAWFLKTNVADGPVYVERMAPQFSMDNDFDTENAKFKVLARFGTTCPDPRGIYSSQGA